MSERKYREALEDIWRRTQALTVAREAMGADAPQRILAEVAGVAMLALDGAETPQTMSACDAHTAGHCMYCGRWGSEDAPMATHVVRVEEHQPFRACADCAAAWARRGADVTAPS